MSGASSSAVAQMSSATPSSVKARSRTHAPRTTGAATLLTVEICSGVHAATPTVTPIENIRTRPTARRAFEVLIERKTASGSPWLRCTRRAWSSRE